jgi:hypothetical protein
MAEMVNFNLANPYQAQLDALARRQQMADIMAQQAYQPMQAPGTYNGIQAPVSHLAGLAKILEGYTAGKEERAIKEERQKLGEEFRTTSAEQGKQFVDALRGTPAQTEIPVPSGEGYMGGEGVGPGRPYEPAKGPDLAKALQLSMGSVNPMVQSAGGSLLGAMMPKAAKWEAAKLEQPDGSVKTGWVDINSSNPASTFQIGGTKPPELEFKDTGGQIIPVNKTTGLPVNVPAIPKVVSPDTQATLKQSQELADRAFNNLSAAQQAQDRREAQRLGVSIQQFNLSKWQAENPTPQIIQSGDTFQAVQPRTATAVPVTAVSGAPIAGPQRQAPEAYSKKADALLNMGDALNDYRNELKGFTNVTALSPDQRARVGQKYQNALLQAKEIYALGVLNGPDKQILEQIIGNPLSITTAPISTEALIKQVEEMSGIIERQNTNLAKVYKQPKIEIPKQQEIMRAKNPTTGEERTSSDGGVTWQPARR